MTSSIERSSRATVIALAILLAMGGCATEPVAPTTPPTPTPGGSSGRPPVAPDPVSPTPTPTPGPADPAPAGGPDGGMMDLRPSQPPPGTGAPPPDAAGPRPDSAPAPSGPDAAPASPPGNGNGTVDRFGVRKIYPTRAMGREWVLPENADRSDGEWQGNAVTRTAEPGVFHVQGSPRIAVSSPAGKPWWRNVELTAYYRLIGVEPGDGPPAGWQLYARGERHITTEVAGASVNQSRPAPPGTIAWPGYPFSGMINGHCLGSSYKGYVNMDGSTQIKKEISHTAGYTGGRGRNPAFTGRTPMNQWFGFKTVIRNAGGDRSVKVEVWLDANADGNWRKTSETTDSGGWNGGSAALDGCTAAPFGYTVDQLVTWAGPYVNFRFDRLSSDLKWLSAREIEPLP
jgi:hypothetical protein